MRKLINAKHGIIKPILLEQIPYADDLPFTPTDVKDPMAGFGYDIKLNNKEKEITSTTPVDLLIGDSICPWVEKKTKARMIPGVEGASKLQKGGIGTPVLLSYLKSYPTIDDHVKNVIISIGSNDLYIDFGIKQLVNQVKTKFPNAKIMVIQGTYGDKIPCISEGYCILSKTKQTTVDTYYNIFKKLGVTVIEPAVGNVSNCHGPLEVYNKIGPNIDSQLKL